jgi:hypothetical protein
VSVFKTSFLTRLCKPIAFERDNIAYCIEKNNWVAKQIVEKFHIRQFNGDLPTVQKFIFNLFHELNEKPFLKMECKIDFLDELIFIIGTRFLEQEELNFVNQEIEKRKAERAEKSSLMDKKTNELQLFINKLK